MSREDGKLRCEGGCRRHVPVREMRMRASRLLCNDCSLTWDRAMSAHPPMRADVPPSARHVTLADPPGGSVRSLNHRRYQHKGPDFAKWRGQ